LVRKAKTGLGEEFLEALDAAAQAIVGSLKADPIRYRKKARAFVLDRFPYLILFVVDGNNIDVISVFNTNQHPKRWKKRLK
jgi:hypothetical protein